MQMAKCLIKEEGIKVQMLEIEKFWSEFLQINPWSPIEGHFDVELWVKALKKCQGRGR